MPRAYFGEKECEKEASIVYIPVIDDGQAHRFMLMEWGWNVKEADDDTTAVAAVAGPVVIMTV